MYFELKQDQEDLFQEILLQLWNSISKFKGQSKFSTWAYRVAINTALVYFKKENKQKEVIQSEPGLWYDSSQDDEVKIFYKAVKHLNKIEKALIIQYLDGLSGEEIAANLGISPGNVRVKTNRTKQKLQDIIKENKYEF
ncbi:DNA-directed RNA polymerase sigma-70 factor [Portibacter lacus]|uniref:DNA-directed RNA polymerase sigma-70 factor n=2 Tax=Portibacter lacus TaxID=1099794 RepID=A0AA37WDI4_9BACT|nr:DNA-directed RNA polymerase sigma-70 factor [Portibacter lacus]